MPHIDTEYQYEKLHTYPHMKPADVLIWERFIESNPERFTRVWYDYHLGDHVHHGETCEICRSTGWDDLTRWKADVIAEDDRAIYAIEIRPSAAANALGNAISYATLYIRDCKPTKPVIPVVLTDVEIPTTRVVADAQSVELWIV